MQEAIDAAAKARSDVVIMDVRPLPHPHARQGNAGMFGMVTALIVSA